MQEIHFEAIIINVDGIFPQAPIVVGVDLKDAIFIYFFFFTVSLLLLPKLDNHNLQSVSGSQKPGFFSVSESSVVNVGALRQSKYARVNLPFLTTGLYFAFIYCASKL